MQQNVVPGEGDPRTLFHLGLEHPEYGVGRLQRGPPGRSRHPSTAGAVMMLCARRTRGARCSEPQRTLRAACTPSDGSLLATTIIQPDPGLTCKADACGAKRTAPLDFADLRTGGGRG